MHMVHTVPTKYKFQFPRLVRCLPGVFFDILRTVLFKNISFTVDILPGVEQLGRGESKAPVISPTIGGGTHWG